MIPRQKNEFVEINASTDTAFGQIGDLLKWRFLVSALTVRDVKLRYKQTVLGFGVVILRPLLSALIMAFVLGHVANLATGEIPLFVFGFVGSILWFYFNHALLNSAMSLLKEGEIITKVHFPHFIPIFASILPAYVDFVVSFSVLVVYLFISGFIPGWTILLAPFIACLVPLPVLSFSLFLAPLIGLFRDFREIANIITQFLVFLTPIYYPFSKVPDVVQPILALNPILWVIEIFRWSVLGHWTAAPCWIAVSFASCVALIAVGLFFFRSLDRAIVDFI
jgi:lipopolysaccharide transport system permease protein